MSDFKISWRLSSSIYGEEENWKAFLRLLDRQPKVTNEIAFAISDGWDDHHYTPLENKRIFSELVALRKKEMDARGIESGINVWPSLDLYVNERRYYKDMPRMVGIDGEVADGVACPISPEFLEYTKEKYRIFAGSGVSFIWVDDDARFTHMDAAGYYPCFCPNCIKGFKNGEYKDRESLVKDLNNPQNRQLRIDWASYGADRLARFCRAAREGVDEVDPTIDLGLMTVGATHTTFSGDYIKKCMDALRSRRGRPGHGFYSDATPNELMWKAMEVGRQLAEYPDYTTNIQWEEDSHPQGHLNKSFATRRNEIYLALMFGCNGVAFNHQSTYGGIDIRLGREVDELAEHRPRYERFLEFSKGLPLCGAMGYYSWFLTSKADFNTAWLKESPFDVNGNPLLNVTQPEKLGPFGIALTTYAENAAATLLSGRTATAMSDEELRRVLSGNVYMDVDALRVLEERGMAALAGVEVAKQTPSRVRMALTDHPFNGPFKNYYTRSTSDTAYSVLVPTAPGVEFLAIRDGYGEIKTGEDSCYISKYENPLGGKIIVNGYDAWCYMDNPHDLYLFSSICEWFKMPCRLRFKNPHVVSRVQPFIRSDGKRAAVMLLNASFDTTNPFELLVRGDMTKAVLLRTDGREMPLDAHREGENLCVDIPEIGVWTIETILLY